MRPNLEALIQELGLQDSVRLVGARAGDQVISLMGQAHIFVLPSTRESLGVVTVEAQATGLPVTCTSVGGIPETLADGKSGFLVPARDPEALAERISYLIEHPERWPEMGRAGRSYVEEHHDIRKLNEQLVSIYESVLAASHPDEQLAPSFSSVSGVPML